MVDLKQHVKLNPYGITWGCVGRCESSPCLNNGTCRYDGYAIVVGVPLRDPYMLMKLVSICVVVLLYVTILKVPSVLR